VLPRSKLQNGEEPPKPAAVLRAGFAAGTVLCAVLGFLADDGTKLFAASGAFGMLWWGWDLLIDYVLAPLSDWFQGLVTGGDLEYEPHSWSVADRIALLEERAAHGRTPRLQILAAIQLAEIYRVQKRDAQRAREVIEHMRARYPDAPEWEPSLDDGSEGGGYAAEDPPPDHRSSV
jgi:hypothetical protein